jgi:putative transposase
VSVIDGARVGFYAWRQRPASARTRQDRVLLEEMRTTFEVSGRTYGNQRIQETLAGRGHRVSRRRVERLTRAAERARASRVYRPKAGASLRSWTSARGASWRGDSATFETRG